MYYIYFYLFPFIYRRRLKDIRLFANVTLLQRNIAYILVVINEFLLTHISRRRNKKSSSNTRKFIIYKQMAIEFLRRRRARYVLHFIKYRRSVVLFSSSLSYSSSCSTLVPFSRVVSWATLNVSDPPCKLGPKSAKLDARDPYRDLDVKTFPILTRYSFSLFFGTPIPSVAPSAPPLSPFFQFHIHAFCYLFTFWKLFVPSFSYCHILVEYFIFPRGSSGVWATSVLSALRRHYTPKILYFYLKIK